ncbi:MAG: aspartate aminotransferase family protein [Candidatus Bathyarchaeia archaeon]
MMSDPIAEYMRRTRRSAEMYEDSKRVVPGGVTHSARHFEPYPLFVKSASGAHFTDADGNDYVDCWCGHGAHIFGHSYPPVIAEVKKQIETATHYGMPHELEAALARQVVKMVPNVEMVRFPNTGTEATMYATRLARGYSGRARIGKFAGGWHGGYDALHLAVKPPLDAPASNGLPGGATSDTAVLPYNDIEGVERIMKKEKLGAVIIEPVLGAGGAIAVEREFLKGLRNLCTENDAVLIFDEVITGFRLAPGGAQEYFGVPADLVCFGKILGGGFPIGGIAGPREVMSCIDFTQLKGGKAVYQGGTFCGNPISMTAGLTTLKLLEDGAVLRRLNETTAKMKKDITDIFSRHNIDVQPSGAGSTFCTHFSNKPVRNIHDALAADTKTLKLYHMHLLNHDVFNLPAHQGFLSAVHSEQDIAQIINATEGFAKRIPS